MVVWCAIYASERIDTGKFLDEPMEISLEFYSTVPGLKGEHRVPHEPKIGFEETRFEPFVDAPLPQVAFIYGHHLDQVKPVLIAESHGGDIGYFPGFDHTGVRMCFDILIENFNFIKNHNAGIVKRWNK